MVWIRSPSSRLFFTVVFGKGKVAFNLSGNLHDSERVGDVKTLSW
jgi:hypothetical protein